jgi:hypothetical protein
VKEFVMCNAESECEIPKNLRTTPQECTPEQIKACHGDVEKHPCAEENNTE